MNRTQRLARSAGLLYLASHLLGLFAYVYIPRAFIVPGDAAATERHLAAGELTFRLGIVSDLAAQIILILAALRLYELFKDVDRSYARLMVVLVAVGATIEMVNTFNLVAPLLLVSGTDILWVFSAAQLHALALAFLKLRSSGLLVAQIFWGLWLFPFGMLAVQSGLFPRILGVLLIVASCAYVADSSVFLVVPTTTHLLTDVARLLGAVGEGAMIVWLLVRGTTEPTRRDPALT